MKKALIVGLNNYPKCELECCVNDAIAIKNLIESNGDGSPNFDVVSITGSCSKGQLQTAVAKLFADDADVALLYFSGHGAEQDGGYTDVERGERGSTEEHLTVTQFKVQAEQQRLEAVTGQVAQAKRGLENAKAATEKQKKKLEALQKETKTAKTVALTVQEIETMGKKATFGNNITLTPDECDTLKRYAVNGIIANADNKRLKEKLASAEKTVSIWKQRYEAVSEKYMELKQKAQPFLDALEIASERVRAFINSILIRGKETQEHKHPAQKRGQDMEL